MTTWRAESRFGQDRSLGGGGSAPRLEPDLSRVLVVGQSQINRIVVARIVERCGLKPVSETPVTALRVLPLIFPGLVIVDGGPENADCEAVISGIAAMRRVSGAPVPAAILLSVRQGDPASLNLAQAIDAVVVKPFTADQLQPAVERVLAGARSLGPRPVSGDHPA